MGLKMVQVIDDIAFQANMLALHLAVASAGAGEATTSELHAITERLRGLVVQNRASCPLDELDF